MNKFSSRYPLVLVREGAGAEHVTFFPGRGWATFSQENTFQETSSRACSETRCRHCPSTVKAQAVAAAFDRARLPGDEDTERLARGPGPRRTTAAAAAALCTLQKTMGAARQSGECSTADHPAVRQWTQPLFGFSLNTLYFKHHTYHLDVKLQLSSAS